MNEHFPPNNGDDEEIYGAQTPDQTVDEDVSDTPQQENERTELTREQQADPLSAPVGEEPEEEPTERPSEEVVEDETTESETETDTGIEENESGSSVSSGYAEEESAENDDAEEEEDGEEADADPEGSEAPERTISADLIRGHINTIILRALYDGDKYGYAIIAEIERKSHRQYQLKQPSLYSALKRLEREGYVTSYWGGSVGGGRRKYFSLTDAGKEIAERNLSEWEYSRTVIDSLISDKDFDFSKTPPSPVDMRLLKKSTSRVPGREEEAEPFFDLDDDLHEDRPAPVAGSTAFVYDAQDVAEEPFAEETAALCEENSEDPEPVSEETVVPAPETVPEAFVSLREPATAEAAVPIEYTMTADDASHVQESPSEEATPVQAIPFATAAASAAEPEISEPIEFFEEREKKLQQRRTALEAEYARKEEELLAREQRLAEAEERRARILAEEAERAEIERIRAEARSREEARIAEELRIRKEAEETAKARYEEQLREFERRRQEDEARKRKEEEARLAEEERLRAERERIAAEEAAREEESRQEEERARRNEERAHVAALNAEKEQQNARIVGMEPFIEERARYEKLLREQEEKFKALHEQALAEQEQRIREEDEALFRHREQQMIHQNYISLVNTPPLPAGEKSGQKESGYYPPAANGTDQNAPVYAAKSEPEREYRSVIRRLYSSALKQDAETDRKAKKAPQTAPATSAAPVQTAPAPARPAQKTAAQSATKSLDGIDFYDLETRAAQDGIRIATSGGAPKASNKTMSVNLVHKGKAMFMSALLVFLICIAEGSVTLALLNTLGLPRFYPYFIWGTGLALLLVTGLAYLNHYGERALRQTGNMLVNAIVSYALCVIVILIVALAAQIDFANAGELATYVVIPIVYFLNLLIFFISYYLQIRPQKD